MILSVVIPAFNEEKLISECIATVHGALKANATPDWTAEVIVVDNNSTDRTALLAKEAGARVVFEPVNQISRARNAGGMVAQGDWLLFVDADSRLTGETLKAVLRCIRRGKCVGGGCAVGLEPLPWGAATLVEVWNFLSRVLRWAAGSLVFCQAEAFREVGGFSTDLYAAEEIHFSQSLKVWGERRGLRFVILPRVRHVSSGRKFALYSFGEIVRQGLRILLMAGWTLRDPAKLGYFYDGRR